MEEEGGSPDFESVKFGTKKKPSISSRDRKEFLRIFVNSKTFITNLENWFEEVADHRLPDFDFPFELVDLQKFDYALEGVRFQQLIRMPSVINASTTSGVMEPTAYLALEDFLHTSVKCLWETFWSKDEPLPFYVSCLDNSNLRFYQVEKAIAKGNFKGLCAAAIMYKNPRHPHGKWDDIVQLVLLRPDIGSVASVDNSHTPSYSVIGEALFFALRVLLARSLRRSSVAFNLNSVFLLLVDSQYGGVMKVEGDMDKLEIDLNNVYGCAADWINNHSNITISPVDRIWNRLGNANWGDIGALQLHFSTFHSIVQYAGMPRHTIEDLAADYSSRLQARREERHLGDSMVNGSGLFRFQQCNASPEIVQVQEESIRLDYVRPIRLEVGSVLWIEDSECRKGYQINEVLTDDGEIQYYVSATLEEPDRPLFLYTASHPFQLERAWEDTRLWYQVQRETKVFSVMKQNDLSTKYLPQLNISGRIVHPGQCRKPSSGENCDHPWCGTPTLVTSPVGKTLADLVRAGRFGINEAIKCCHDCLSALSIASHAGILHGDIRPENVIYVTSELGQPYFVLTGWGHAILEETDRPVMNLHYSSTYTLQEEKLCPASDSESLLYLVYFSVGADFPDLNSIVEILQWRETSWSKRMIQQKLGEISAILKAFADYVDSICGTPYPIDYEIWLKRLRKHIHEEEDHGKEIDFDR